MSMQAFNGMVVEVNEIKPLKPHRQVNKAVSRIRQRYCSGTCLKFVYLACATMVSASFIIECILIHLIITPYISESVFESGVCFLYLSQIGRRVKCENKCSKDRSAFPCATVQVLYLPTRTSANEVPMVIAALKNRDPSAQQMLKLEEARLLFLYDYFSTYGAYRADQCSTSPCNRREADNDETVDQYLRELRSTSLLPCHARPLRLEITSRLNYSRAATTAFPGDYHDHPVTNTPFLPMKVIESLLAQTANINGSHQSSDLLPQIPVPRKDDLMAAALMHRLYPESLLFHSLFWPSLVLVSGLLLITAAYAVDGCKVWVTDMTVIA